MKNPQFLWWSLPFVLVLIITLFPYAKAEILTYQFGDEFAGLEKQTNMLTDTDYFKVLSYTDNRAEVFYVSGSGNLLTFQKNQSESWKLIE